MESAEGHEERKAGIYSDKSRKTDHILQKAVVIRMQISSTDDEPCQAEVTTQSSKLGL
jgi:hypothetical protein